MKDRFGYVVGLIVVLFTGFVVLDLAGVDRLEVNPDSWNYRSWILGSIIPSGCGDSGSVRGYLWCHLPDKEGGEMSFPQMLYIYNWIGALLFMGFLVAVWLHEIHKKAGEEN